MTNIDFGSTSNDDPEPWSMRRSEVQSPQDPWTSESVATLINCVDDKDEGTIGRAGQFADEPKEEEWLDRPWHQVWIMPQVFCNEASKRGEYYREFVDESRQDIYGLVQICVIPLAEKSASKMILFAKPRTN